MPPLNVSLTPGEGGGGQASPHKLGRERSGNEAKTYRHWKLRVVSGCLKFVPKFDPGC